MPGIGGCTDSAPVGAAPTGGTTVGGPAPYWTSYSYDSRGDRTAMVQHDTSGDTSKDVATTQTFAAAGVRNTPTTDPATGGGTGGAHALLATSSTGPGAPGNTAYQYDAEGNTTALTATAGTTTFTWNAEDRLEAVAMTGTQGGTGYVYDADGNQLIRRDPGTTTLNLGNDELVLNTAADTVTDTRTYHLPNGLSAVRQASTLTWQVADQNGTATLALDSATLAETRRRADPFGQPRGTPPGSWAGDHGFVGGTQDPATGLTNLGAREYQPSTGRFLNPDPLLDAAQPQQWNGYSYGNNDPLNESDPLGTDPPGTQNSCAYDLSQCSTSPGNNQCKGVHNVPCGKKDTVTYGSPGKGKGLTVGSDDHGAPTLDGIRVPTKEELVAMRPGRWKDSYGQLIVQWIADSCNTEQQLDKQVQFCQDAEGTGLLPTSKDPFGISDFVKCVKKGQDCGSLIVDLASDALMVVPGVGEMDEAGVAARGVAEAADGTRVVDGVADAESSLDQLAKGVCLNANSFPGATRVLRADGTSTPIQDIRVGDTVEATDPLTGQTRSEKVQAVVKTLTDTDFTDITVADAGRSRTLTSTQHHPYWDVTDQRWTDATALRAGDALRLPDGRTATIRTVRDHTGHITTYNLTVANLHTYYVMAGATPILVHNSNCGGRWKLGDDYSTPNKNGVPSSLSTMRKRFWKNEAAEPGAADQYGAANIGRMKRGSAPQRQRPDGSWESMELSHEPIPDRDGGMLLTPRWPEDHAIMDPGGYRRLPPGY